MQEREEAGESPSPLPHCGEGGPSRERPVGEGAAETNIIPRARQPGDKPLASPSVRKRAWDLGVELRFVPGTGPGGRITHDDSMLTPRDEHNRCSATGGLARRDGVEDVPITGLRRTIAERLQEAKATHSAFFIVEEIDVTALEECECTSTCRPILDRA